MERKIDQFRKGLGEIDLAEITFRKRTGDGSIASAGQASFVRRKMVFS
jgi:hypothetical protein